MVIEQQILFFLAALGVFNGLLMAIYFIFVVNPKRKTNLLFGLMLLMLCIRIGKSLFHSFMELERVVLQIGLSACIMVGPFLFLYLKNFHKDDSVPLSKDWLHILLPLFTIVIVGLIWPYENYPNFWNSIVFWTIYGTWILYMFLSMVLVSPLFSKLSENRASIQDKWLVLVSTSMSLLCFAYVLAYFGFPYLAGPIVFSLIFYILAAYLLSSKNRSLILRNSNSKYQNKKINKEKAISLLEQLEYLMQTQKPYLTSEIKLKDVANAIESTPHEISQLINSHLNLTFNQYINKYRISASWDLLKNNDQFTVEGIGQEVGFRSRSAFYSAFKNFTKMTPAQFKAKSVEKGQ